MFRLLSFCFFNLCSVTAIFFFYSNTSSCNIEVTCNESGLMTHTTFVPVCVVFQRKLNFVNYTQS